MNVGRNDLPNTIPETTSCCEQSSLPPSERARVVGTLKVPAGSRAVAPAQGRLLPSGPVAQGLFERYPSYALYLPYSSAEVQDSTALEIPVGNTVTVELNSNSFAVQIDGRGRQISPV